MSGERLSPPPLDELDQATAELLALASGPDGAPRLTIGVLAHHPPLVGPFLEWAAALALQGALATRDHELLALRTAWLCGSDFEWDEHVGYARAAGLSFDEIERVRAGPDAGWDGRERSLLQAADELHRHQAITDATWSTLAAHHERAALVEVLYVVGQYTMLSMVANAIKG
jgi:4-carboxymuconolactone decarboxylase